MLKERTQSGPSHSILCPGRGSSLSGIWLCPRCCQHITGCLEAATPVSRRASQGCSSAPSLPWSFRGKESLVYFIGWSCAAALALYHCECQVCSCASSALTIQGGPFLLPGLCSVRVLRLCLYGHLQNWGHFRSLLDWILFCLITTWAIMLLSATGTSLNKSPESLGLSTAVPQARCCSKGPLGICNIPHPSVVLYWIYLVLQQELQLVKRNLMKGN